MRVSEALRRRLAPVGLLLAAFSSASVALLAAAPDAQAQPQAQTQTTGPAPVHLLINSLAGPDLFKAYCSACHGADGRGNGPAAASLKTPPADLTSLARRSGGTFPQARVQAVLSGDGQAEVVAHGTATMPVWGPIFRAFEAGPQADVRIANLVKYLASTQRP